MLAVGTVQVPAGRFDNCFLINDDWVTDTVESWFCPGVGWVEYKGDHNGTPYGSHRVLLRYSTKQTFPGGARATLDRFMQARIDRQDQSVLGLLADELQARLESSSADLSLFQVSNPCWYRYLVVQFEQTALTKARARVRMYEHFWGGDIAGGLPQSWEPSHRSCRDNNWVARG